MALGYQNPFYLKQAQQKQQSLYNGKVLLEKHDSLDVYDSEKTLQLAQEKFSDDTTVQKALLGTRSGHSDSDGASLYEARATGAAPGTKLIWNSTCHIGGNLGKSFGKTSEKSVP
ncbi:hypothetical protein Tco_0883302 [Tanacetum coccineum]